MADVAAFIDALTRFVREGNRGALADLRRSVAFPPGTYPPAYPYVERYVTTEYERPWYYLVAGLYALWAQGAREPEVEADTRENFGRTVARLYEKRGHPPSIKQRFVALLDADSDELPTLLRQMIALLRSENIPVNWAQLLEDLLWWRRNRRVAQRWARGFYRPDQPGTTDHEEMRDDEDPR